jgi:Zn-dependent protease with chaperone function
MPPTAALPASDFFSHQETARKKTGALILYFALAVLAIIALTYLVIAGAFLAAEQRERPAATGLEWNRLFDWQLLTAVTGGTLLLVGGGSAYRIVSLSAGGRKVAELLGGKLLDPNTRDPDERKVLNVVEEMAIASGCPVPPVYLLQNERGINAFAAGKTPSDAVIGVTRGCIETLSRDELQGVIAHEFSHILNGDMKLNIRLMGILYGILLISTTGWIIFRSTAHGRTSRDDDRRGGNPLPLIGLALYVLGYVGVLFGRLIKAAVSRQREYLADASAVQFSRNPHGIAGALKKIGAAEYGSRVRTPEAEEASHMFFGEALGLGAWNPLATHPPLAERIRRIDPSFDGDFSKVSLEPPESQRLAEEMRRLSEAAGREQVADDRRADRRRAPFNPVEAITRVGTLTPQNVAFAAALLDGIPEPLIGLAREPFGAVALVYSMLIDRHDGDVRARQLQMLDREAEPGLADTVRELVGRVGGMRTDAYLPLIELSLPALKRLSRAQFERFIARLRHLMEADQKISLFEYAMRRMLLRHLGPQFGWGRAVEVRYDTAPPLVRPVATILSALSNVGHADPRQRETAYQRGVAALAWSEPLPPLFHSEETNLNAVDEALNTIAGASPPLKRAILSACASTIGADGQITIEEGELLRAISDALDCPMPPLAHAGAAG